MSAHLSVRDLRAFYGQTQALHGLDLDLEPGGITALLGANGAGKTTVLRAICGMIRSEGEIRLDGKPIGGFAVEDVVHLGVAHVPEGRGTFVRLTVEENLELGAMIRTRRAEIERDVERVYEHFPRLKERRHQQAGTLSGGEQQMLAVGRALMLRPKVMLLDEPSFGLAPLVVAEVFEILKAVNKSDRVSVLLVEQNASLALALADRAYLIETGRIVMSGTTAEIGADENIRRAYLGY